KNPDTKSGPDNAARRQNEAKGETDRPAPPIADSAGHRGGGDVAGDARHRDCRRDAEKDQQRRHEESAADPEHAGDESDREPHSENDEHVDRQGCDRKGDLQARGPWFEAQGFAGRLTPVPPKGLIWSRPKSRRHSPKWPSCAIAVQAGKGDMRFTLAKGTAAR